MYQRFVRFIFDTWESIFHKAAHLEEIEPGVEHLFYIAKRRYVGPTFSIDGVEVHSFDHVIELHFNNDMVERTLRADENLVRAMVQLIRYAKESMPALVAAIQHERFSDAKALYGITFIHRGIERFGFETRPIPDGISKKVTRWHLKNVLKMLNPDANHVIGSNGGLLEPKLVVASKYSMINRFASEHSDQSAESADKYQSLQS